MELIWRMLVANAREILCMNRIQWNNVLNKWIQTRWSVRVNQSRLSTSILLLVLSTTKVAFPLKSLATYRSLACSDVFLFFVFTLRLERKGSSFTNKTHPSLLPLKVSVDKSSPLFTASLFLLIWNIHGIFLAIYKP